MTVVEFERWVLWWNNEFETRLADTHNVYDWGKLPIKTRLEIIKYADQNIFEHTVKGRKQ